MCVCMLSWLTADERWYRCAHRCAAAAVAAGGASVQQPAVLRCAAAPLCASSPRIIVFKTSEEQIRERGASSVQQEGERVCSVRLNWGELWGYLIFSTVGRCFKGRSPRLRQGIFLGLLFFSSDWTFDSFFDRQRGDRHEIFFKIFDINLVVK